MCRGGRQKPAAVLFFLRFEYERRQTPEHDRRAYAGRRSAQPAGEYPKYSLLVYRFANALRKRVSEPCQRHFRSRFCKFREGPVQTDGSEQNPRDDVTDKYPGRR